MSLPFATNLRIAISGTELSPEDGCDPLMAAAAALGIDAVEIWHPQNIAALTLERTADRLSSAGLHVACLSSGVELYREGGSHDDQRRLNELIDCANRLGAPRVNTYFGHAPVVDDAKAIEVYSRLLEPCLRHAERHGIVILLENEFDAFGWDPASSDITRRPTAIRQLIDRVDSDFFRLTFDPANFFCADVDPLGEAYALLHPFVAYVHVKDIRPLSKNFAPGKAERWREYRDHERRFMTCPLGEGVVPWPEILHKLMEKSYHVILTLEPHSLPEHRMWAWQQSLSRIEEILRSTASGISSDGLGKQS